MMQTEITFTGVDERLVVKGGVDVVAGKLIGPGPYFALEDGDRNKVYVRADKIAFLKPVIPAGLASQMIDDEIADSIVHGAAVPTNGHAYAPA